MIDRSFLALGWEQASRIVRQKTRIPPSVRKIVALIFCVSALTHCAPPPQPPSLVLTPVAYSELTDWGLDDQSGALRALRQTCARFDKLKDDRPVGPGSLAGTIADWRPLCAAAREIDVTAPAARSFFETWFDPFLASDNDEAEGLFTGYFEAELHGSRMREGPYQTPLYARPSDMVTADLGEFRDDWKGKKLVGRLVDGRLRPYPSRAEIEAGALTGKDLEILWVDDPIDAFFLQIQGSGRVSMNDGQTVRLGYAAQNGHKYVAIGRQLIERGEVPREQMSMQAIRSWLEDNPDQAPKLMNSNPSFVFFRELTKPGPIGAQGVPLTPGRSLAVDLKFIPMGVPVWLDTTDPLSAGEPLRRLVVAQDTGGAIRGPVRGDLFWGFGDEAARKAGPMKQQGNYYLLLPKSVRKS